MKIYIVKAETADFGFVEQENLKGFIDESKAREFLSDLNGLSNPYDRESKESVRLKWGAADFLYTDNTTFVIEDLELETDFGEGA